MEHNIKLTPRLRGAADWVPDHASLCDVGTDHAYLPTALMLEGRISHAIASDIRKGPLERAAATLTRYGISQERIELRLCPGLEVVREGEGNAVTICGMGGEMICGILEAAPWTKRGVTLVLQPQRSQDELRLWLREHGYRILKERVVAEGERWYTLLLAEGGEEAPQYTPASLLAGLPERWVREENRLAYLEALCKKQRDLLQRLERSTKNDDEDKKQTIQTALRELEDWVELIEKGEWPQ